jgi:hypothetical protein
MPPILLSIILLTVWVGLLLLAERTGILVFAVAGGIIVGVLEGFFRTDHLFVRRQGATRQTRVASAVFAVAAIVIVVGSGISWPTLIAYAVPWFLAIFAVFTWNAYHRGA